MGTKKKSDEEITASAAKISYISRVQRALALSNKDRLMGRRRYIQSLRKLIDDMETMLDFAKQDEDW